MSAPLFVLTCPPRRCKVLFRKSFQVLGIRSKKRNSELFWQSRPQLALIRVEATKAGAFLRPAGRVNHKNSLNLLLLFTLHEVPAMLSQLKKVGTYLGRLFGDSRRNGKATRRDFMACRARLNLEALEDRTAPAVFTWTGAAGGGDQNWSNPANWTGAEGIPTATDDVIFSPVHNVASTVDGLFAVGTVDELTILGGYNKQLTLQRSLTVRLTAQWDGTIFGSSSYIVPAAGVYDWYGGTLRGFAGPGSPNYNTIIEAGATMNITPAVVHELDGRTIKVYGTLNWHSGVINVTNAGHLNILGGATLNMPNAFVYDVQGDLTGLLTMAGAATVPNGATLIVRIPSTWTGTLTLPGLASIVELRAPATMAGASVTTGIGTVNNYTTVTTTTGSAIVKGGVLFVQQTGSTINAAGGTFQVTTGSELQIVGASNLAGAGGVIITATGILTITNNLTVTGTVTNNNVATWQSGTITVSGLINNNATFDVDSPNALTLAGTGTFNNNAAGSLLKNQLNSLTINNAANNLTFNNNGRIQINQGIIILQNSWTQPFGGRTTFASGNLQVGGTFTNSGSIFVDTTGTIFANSVVNNNTIDMRNPDDAVNTLIIASIPGGGPGGNFTQAGIGRLYLDIYSATDSDRLVVAGTATLARELIVGLGDGYQPAGQNPITWTLITYAQRINQFESITYPAGNWRSTYWQMSFTVKWSPN